MTKAERLLQDPQIQGVLAANRAREAAEKAEAEKKDIAAVKRLAILLPKRKRRFSYRGLAAAYLYRYRGGWWHRGGNHVSRAEFGPGIGFTEPGSDGVSKIVLLNLPPEDRGGQDLPEVLFHPPAVTEA